MDERQKRRAEAQWCPEPPQCGPWTLRRLDVISTVQPKKWPVCRLELIHQERGRVFEIGTGAGCLDAAFNAVAELIGVTAPVKTLEVDFECAEADALPQVTVEIEIEVNQNTWRGYARTADLMLSAVGAYLDAIVRALDQTQNSAEPPH
jgi:molybdenum cofactor biosynthesis enzyme